MRDPGIPRNHTLLTPKMGLCNREYEKSLISQKTGLCNREYGKHTIFIEIFDFREKILMRDPGIPRNHTLLTPKMGLCNREYEKSLLSQKTGLCNREYGKHTIFIEIFDFREKS